MRIASILVALGCAWVFGIASVQARPGDRVERHPFLVGQDSNPSVAADADGNFVVVWASLASGLAESGIWGRLYALDGLPLGERFRVSPIHVQLTSDDFPAVAMDSDGDFVVTWFQRYGPTLTEREIRGQRFNSVGVRQGTMFTVSDPAYEPIDGYDKRSAVAMDADGDFVIVWTAKDPDFAHTRSIGQRYAASGVRRGSNFRVSSITASTFKVSYTVVAMNSDGDFVVVWEQSLDGATPTVRGKRFSAQGIAQGGSFAVPASSGPGYVKSPSVAMGAGGNFVAVFNRYDLSGQFGSESIGIYARRFDALAKPLGPEFRVSTIGRVQYRGEITVDMDTAGNFVIAWIANASPEGGETFLHTRLFGASGSAMRGDRQYGFNHSNPRQEQVAMDGTGNFLVAWQSGSNINAQRFAGPEDTRAGCGGFIASIVGTNGSDTLTGTVADDVIHGQGGNDWISGGDGADSLCGGSGDDQLFGDEGTDHLLGGAGDDVLNGGTESDICDGDWQVNADTAVDCEKTIDVP